MMHTTSTHCHCGAEFTDSDHCKCCGCEQFERTCTWTCKDAGSDEHDETCWDNGVRKN